MSRNEPGRQDALWVLSFPAVLALGVLILPVVPDYGDHAQAAQAAASTTRWLVGHLVSAAAFGLGMLAASVLAGRLAGAGRPRAAAVARPLMAVGAALHAAGLGADGMGPLASATAGGGTTAFFDGSAGLVPPVFVAGAVLFGVGQIVLAAGLARSGLLPRRAAPWAVGAAVGFSVAEAVPSGWGLYGVAAAAIVLYGLAGLPVLRDKDTGTR